MVERNAWREGIWLHYLRYIIVYISRDIYENPWIVGFCNGLVEIRDKYEYP